MTTETDQLTTGARSKEQGARSKEQAARSEEQGARSKESPTCTISRVASSDVTHVGECSSCRTGQSMSSDLLICEC